MHTSTSAGPTRFHALLDHWAARQPHQSALTDAHHAYTFAQLQQASMDAATQLGNWGVRAGDRVLIVGENCAAAGVIAFALSRLDAWVCIVNGRLSPREIDGIIAHAMPRRVIYTTHVSPDALQHAQRHGAAEDKNPVVGVRALPGGKLDALGRARKRHGLLGQRLHIGGQRAGIVLFKLIVINTGGLRGQKVGFLRTLGGGRQRRDALAAV